MEITTGVNVIDPAASESPLVLADRCDYCNAQAFVIAQFLSGDLLFCGHHYARFEINIGLSALGVTDARLFINHKPNMALETETVSSAPVTGGGMGLAAN